MYKINQDMLWKELIRSFFKEAMEFFAQEMSKLIDYNEEYIFLDKELNKLLKGQRRYCDTLVQVTLKDKSKTIILIHIEVQSYYEKEFGKRMFDYLRLIWARYQQDVYGVAIFTGNNIGNMGEMYTHKIADVEIQYKYKTYEIAKQDIETLKNSDNIFALVVLATQYIAKEKEDRKRADFKRELIKLLKEKNIDKEKRSELFTFLDFMVQIENDSLNIETHKELMKIMGGERKKVKKLLRIENSPFYKNLDKVILMIEREKGEEEGLEKGKEEASINIAKKLLQSGFSMEQIIEITGVTEKDVKKHLTSDSKRKKVAVSGR